MAESASGTTSLLPTPIIDEQGKYWTLRYDGKVLRDNVVKWNGWMGKMLLYYKRTADASPQLFLLSLTDKWYLLNKNTGGVTSLAADPRPVEPAPPAQTIDSFTLTHTSVTAGQSVTATWATSNASAVTLDGAPVPAVASSTDTPTASKSYTLVAKGSAADVSRTVDVTVTPAAPQPPLPSADFDTRKTAPGVVRWFDFDSDAQLGSIFPANFGFTPGNGNFKMARDPAVKASGASSLRFDVPANVDNTDCGWYANYSPDLSVRFGANSEHFIQWRQRFNQAFVDTIFKTGDGSVTAIKQLIIGSGDNPAMPSVNYGSCTATDVVVVTYGNRRFPTMYHRCGVYAGLYESVGGGSDFDLQNEMPSCLYSTSKGQEGTTAVPSGCFGWAADEWMTFEVGITLGPLNTTTGNWDNSRVRLWGARENQPPVLILDWKSGVPGYFPLHAGSVQYDERIGKVWLTPYMTGMVATPRQLCQTWYDELIISRQPVKFPGGHELPLDASPSLPPPPPPPSGDANSALLAIPKNNALDIGPFNVAEPRDNPGAYYRWWEYSGMVYEPTSKKFLGFGGGHGTTTRTDIITFDPLTAKWGNLYPSTLCAEQTVANHDYSKARFISSNHPTCRHTYDMLVAANYGGSSKFLIMTDGGLGGLESCHPNPGTDLGPPKTKIARYDMAKGEWSYSAIWPLPWYYASASSWDEQSQRVLVAGYSFSGGSVGLGNVWIYDPVGDALITAGSVPGNCGYAGSLVYFPPNDKHYLIGTWGGDNKVHVFEITVNRSNLAASSCTEVTGMTGNIPPLQECSFVYDSVNKLLGGFNASGYFWAYNPLTKEWLVQKMNVSSAGGHFPQGNCHHAIGFDPVHGVYIFLGLGSTIPQTWAYRW